MGFKQRPGVYLFARPKNRPPHWPKANGGWVVVRDEGWGYSSKAERGDSVRRFRVELARKAFEESFGPTEFSVHKGPSRSTPIVPPLRRISR